jgi:hypothetical protein
MLNAERRANWNLMTSSFLFFYLRWELTLPTELLCLLTCAPSSGATYCVAIISFIVGLVVAGSCFQFSNNSPSIDNRARSESLDCPIVDRK